MVAALALYAGACILLPLGEVRIIASISALGILAVFIGVHAAVLVLRFKTPGRLPLRPPLGIAISLALMTQFEPVVYAVTAAAVAFGVAVYGGTRGRSEHVEKSS